MAVSKQRIVSEIPIDVYEGLKERLSHGQFSQTAIITVLLRRYTNDQSFRKSVHDELLGE